MQDQLAETKEKYRQASGGVQERTRILAEVTEELEDVKRQMDDRGSSMTDGGEERSGEGRGRVSGGKGCGGVVRDRGEGAGGRQETDGRPRIEHDRRR